MKRTATLLILLCLCLLLGACAAPANNAQQDLTTPPVDCTGLLEAIRASQTFDEMIVLSENQTLEYLDLNEGLLVDMAMGIDASRATAEMIAVLSARDEEALGQAKEALEAYRDVTLEQYRDYRPEEVPKLESAIFKTKGLQTVLIVSADQKAAEKALDAAWAGTQE